MRTTGDDETNGNGDAENEVEVLSEVTGAGGGPATASSSSSSMGLRYFNEDIVCPHGRLSTTSSKRLISASLFQLLCNYFTSDQAFLRTIEFTNSTRECADCLVSHRHLDKTLTSNKTFVSGGCFFLKKNVARQADHAAQLKKQRDELSNLYANENRPNLELDETTATDEPQTTSVQPITYYLVSNEFITEWRSMVRSGRHKSVEIHNSSLLCAHARLIKTSSKEC